MSDYVARLVARQSLTVGLTDGAGELQGPGYARQKASWTVSGQTVTTSVTFTARGLWPEALGAVLYSGSTEVKVALFDPDEVFRMVEGDTLTVTTDWTFSDVD